MANVSLTYGEMRAAASQLQAGEQRIQNDLASLKRLIDNLVASGYVSRSSQQFGESFTEFTAGATKMMAGLTSMARYLDAAVRTFEGTDEDLAKALKRQ